MLKYEGHRCYPAGYEDDSDASVDGLEILPPPSLRITVVPNITKGAGLNWEDFDATLTEEMETWFVSFEKMWNIYKRTPSMIQNLKVVYLNDENPLLLALKFFSRCPGCNNLKNKNLALFVLDTVCNLYKTNPEIAEMCTDNMRMVAFNFIKTCGVLPLYKSITEAYELTKIKDLLMAKIQELIDDKRYKDAAYWAINLRVTQCFDIYQIVLPLILQSKSSLAVECLDLAKDQQEETVRFLDSLLDKQKTVLDHCYQIIEKHGYIDLNHSVISFRPMSKLVARLAKMYDIGAHCTPNLSYTKSWSYMYYLYKRFKDGEMSRDSFRELVKDAATTTALRYGLVSNIASHGDREEALYWVRLYQIPTDQWPSSLQADIPADVDQTNDTVDGWESDQSPLSQSNSSLASSGKPHGKGEYLQLELRDESVILVDRRSAFMSMIRTLETQSLIGFDSEWKPSACQVESVSLLQLATYDKVFLIDVTSDEITDDLWKVLGRNIFNNLEILKIGFALQQDLNMLQKSLPQMNLCLASASCYLDLKDLWKRLMYLQCFAFPYKGASRVGTSLSALTEICLGKKLDKSNQLSNWAKRPLRRDQIIYAAVDVFCLIQIYKVIADSLNRLGYDIDQMVDQITSSHSTKPDRMANKSLDSTASSRLPRKTSRNAAAESISSTDIRFFCDGMLGGLLHNLRRLGIDCLEINGRANVEQIIRRAQQENRYILARDSRFTQNAKSQTKSFCIEIPEDAADVQVVNVIQYFNIAINKKKVNPRCPTCNGLEFISATRHQMQILKFGVSPQSVAFTSASNSASYWHKSVKFIFHSKPITEEVLSTGKTFSLAVIKVGKLSTNNVFAHNVFFICDKCGRITWPSDYRLSSKIEQQIVAED